MSQTSQKIPTKWQLAEPAPVEFLAQFPELPKPVAQLLYNRGLRDDAAIGTFLNPVYSQELHDPLQLKGLAAAVATIEQAIAAEQRIVIHGDYDADGITATALLLTVLKQLGARVSSFLPNRYLDGYGVSSETLQRLRKEGTDLVITVDCGISSAAAIAAARRSGLQVVVTDHHLPPAKLPIAEAVVNPNQPGDRYPNKALTGVGVAFKLAQQLLRQSRLTPAQQEAAEKWLLDLVAIGTVADMASLTGENRTLVKFGLTVLAKQRRIGLRELIKSAAVKQINAASIGFAIAPRLNAAGRLTDAERALELLTTEDPAGAALLANELNDLNLERRRVTAEAVDQAKSQLGELTLDDRVIVLDGQWLSGVVGLVAGRLVQEYRRPALVIERGQTISRGSARSIPALNIVEALAKHRRLLKTFGGHAGAAGFSLETGRLEEFRQALSDFSRQALSVADLAQELAIEAELSETDLSFDLLDQLDSFEPCGIDNPSPKFLLAGFQPLETTTVGADQRHLKIVGRLPGGRTLTALAFGLAERLPELKASDRIDLAGYPVANTWQNNKSLEWHVDDFRPGT